MSSGSLADLGARARRAARDLALADPGAKDEALRQAADRLEDVAPELLAANAADVEQARSAGATEAEIDRLALGTARVEAMCSALRTVSELADPVGEVVERYVRPNGLRVERVRVPLGVVGIIYENRPNVTSDTAALCLRSGNAVLLRGSAAALASNRVVAAALRSGVAKAGLPEDSVVLVEDVSHETAREFVRLRGVIDCLIPRGGHGLFEMVLEHATVPYVLDGDGNCHLYVDKAADLEMAIRILSNAKLQRPGVCNAVESLLVHKDVAGTFLPLVAAELTSVTFAADERAIGWLPSARPASDADFATEFLGLELSVGIVDDVDGAIDHIARFGSGHSEAIVTSDRVAARRFLTEVDAAAVLHNASTRFVDGSELGLGAEVGISTQKLHARGPMGARELTSIKYTVYGEGQIRT